jgi:hypothetical protein
MRRCTLILAGVVAAFYLSTSSARADCRLVPYWYPQSWEVMLPRYCLPEYSEISDYPVARPRYHRRHVQLPRRVRVAGAYQRTYIISRRPYLRPGWWW